MNPKKPAAPQRPVLAHEQRRQGVAQKTLQPKSGPIAPPVYRPQPIPKALQRKTVTPPKPAPEKPVPRKPPTIAATRPGGPPNSVVQPFWGALIGGIVGAAAIATSVITAPAWAPVALSGALGGLIVGAVTGQAVETVAKAITAPPATPTPATTTTVRKRKPPDKKQYKFNQEPAHKRKRPPRKFQAPPIDYALLLDTEDPEITQAKADAREYKALTALREAHRERVVTNNEATAWLAQNTVNVNRAPSPNGNTENITNFNNIINGLPAQLGYSTRHYYNNDGIMAGGLVLAGRFVEARLLPGSRRVIRDTANAPSTYFTDGGTHNTRAGFPTPVAAAWWVHWTGVRWFYWDTTNHQDVEFQKGTLVAANPLTTLQQQRLAALEVIRAAAMRSGKMRLTQIWGTV